MHSSILVCLIAKISLNKRQSYSEDDAVDINLSNIKLLALLAGKKCSSSEETWIPFTQKYFVLSLVDIGLITGEHSLKLSAQVS